MVTVVPGQSNPGPQSERGPVLSAPSLGLPEPSRAVSSLAQAGPEPVSEPASKPLDVQTPSPELPGADVAGTIDRPTSRPGEPAGQQSAERISQLVEEARDLQSLEDAAPGSPAGVAEPNMVALPEPNTVALPEPNTVALPEPVSLDASERAQAIAAYQSAQNLTDSGRLLMALGGDAGQALPKAA